MRVDKTASRVFVASCWSRELAVFLFVVAALHLFGNFGDPKGSTFSFSQVKIKLDPAA